jgi:hypothetical protein
VKYLKLLVLAAVVVTALLAIAGTASAAEGETTLCKAKEGTEAAPTCSTANMYPPGTVIAAKLKSAEAKLEAGIATVKCTESAVGGETKTTETPKGPITTLTFGKCNFVVTPLPVGGPYGELTVHHSTGWNGILTAEGVKVEVVISGSIKCFYGGTITTGLTLIGGAPAVVKAINAPIPRLAGSSTSCASTALWNAEYEVTAPNPLWVATM